MTCSHHEADQPALDQLANPIFCHGQLPKQPLRRPQDQAPADKHFPAKQGIGPILNELQTGKQTEQAQPEDQPNTKAHGYPGEPSGQAGDYWVGCFNTHHEYPPPGGDYSIER